MTPSRSATVRTYQVDLSIAHPTSRLRGTYKYSASIDLKLFEPKTMRVIQGPGTLCEVYFSPQRVAIKG